MCSTRNGVQPGVNTGIVISRSTNALRSTIEAYPIPARVEPSATAPVRIKAAIGSLASVMPGSLLPPGDADRDLAL